MKSALSQHDWDDLSAWLDGELPPEQAARVARAVAADPAWSTAADELRALDSLLVAHAAPEPAADLPARIRAAARNETRAKRPAPVLRLVRWLAPAAAAAAVLIAAVAILSPDGGKDPRPALSSSGGRDAGNGGRADAAKVETTAEVLDSATEAEAEQLAEIVAMERLDMFRDYDIVKNYDTLAAIEQLEHDGGGM